MLTNILYVSATSSLLVGSILSFDSQELPDYFYLVGTSLFCFKSILSLGIEIRKKHKSSVEVYHAIN